MDQPAINQPNFRRRALFIAFLASVLVYILWNTPALEIIVIPVRLFVTYVHEAGHSLAALLTGGSIGGFVVSPNGSGVAATAGGIRAIIIPAGYLGSALFGSLLFFLANRFPRWTQGISVVVGLALIVFTLLFARPDEAGNITALLVGVGFGAILTFVGWKLNATINLIILDILGVMTALEAVRDVWFVVQNSSIGRGDIVNDAAAFSRDITPLIPPAAIAVIWAGIAILLFALAIWYGVVRPLRRELDESYRNSIGKLRES